MLLRLRSLAERLRGSLFYVPALYVVGAVALAWLASWMDARLAGRLRDNPLLLTASADSARAVLATIAAATITVAGISFSVTVVAVQLAASQFSPRVLRGFLRDRFSQNIIGIEVGTFAYCLLILTTTTRDPEAGPSLTRELPLTVAVVLAMVAIIGIVAFIDHSARSMQVGQLMRSITHETRERLAGLFPEHVAGAAGPTAEATRVAAPDAPGHAVRAASEGWIQQLDTHALLRAVPPGSIMRLEVRVGSFTVAGSRVATVWPVPEEPDAVDQRVQDAMALGATRTMQQEVAFGLRQLVDIGLRALSPGVNDPTTAYEALAHLEAILADLLRRDLPPTVAVDDEDRRLHRPRELDHADYVRRAFEQFRAAASNQPGVCLAIVQALGRLAELLEAAGLGDRTTALREQARLTVQGLEAGTALPEDVERVRAAARTLGLDGAGPPRTDGTRARR